MSIIKNLVSEIVDYAGLFPPAKLPLDQVVQNFESYLGCNYAWMLARLILPVEKIEEFEEQPAFSESSHVWKISLLIPGVDVTNGAFDSALISIQEFNARYASSGKAIIDTVEVKAPSLESIQQTITRMPTEINAFLEIPYDDDPAKHVAAIQTGGDNIFAKIRTGGVTTDLIPNSAEIARFIATCAVSKVGFKATAGLHHPLRGEYRLTYDDQPDFGTMFGYLNVFIATCFAFSGHTDVVMLEQILNATDASDFNIDNNTLIWKNISISGEDIARIRNNKIISFGSCSFTEPTIELEKMGWLDTTQVK